MMAAAPQPAPRYYDLDALRAAAMFLLVLLHGTYFVLSDPAHRWPVLDPSVGDDPTYGILLNVSSGFLRPTFFLISGLFSALLWQKRGLRGLGMHRLKRLGVPFFFGCVIIIPLTGLAMALTSGRQEPFDFPFWILPFFSIWALMHLWFLWYLMLFIGLFILLARLGLQFRNPAAWWAVIPLSAALSLVMSEPVFGPDTVRTLLPVPAPFFHYACFFFFGAFLYQQGVSVRRRWMIALLPAAAAFYMGDRLLRQYSSIGTIGSDLAEPAFMFSNSLTLASALFETAYAWLMCFGAMGLFNWLFSRPNFTVRYLSDATYWTYLVHLPLVILAQWLVVAWPISYHLKYILVCASVTATALITYQLFVRYTFIGSTLNGPRTRRAQDAAPAILGQNVSV